MIIGIIKTAKSNQNKNLHLANIPNKEIASGKDVIFELKIRKKSQTLDYDIKFIDDDLNTIYIYKKSDIVANININGLNFLIISGNIETFVNK
ncbi:MAG: hypothetical protein ACTSRG_02685 [Candidatus Helarchaeota archaeon]